ncbi:MAG: sodium:proton antiporter [Gammaproteobacteria bacterium]|nr:sodium:proton antiporter [Gammaproteobacteria bacterium]
MPATHTVTPSGRWKWRTAFSRGAGYFALWMVIVGGKSADFAPGLGAAALAAWLSLRLMPPDPCGGEVRWWAAIGLLAHFAKVSVLAGLDVARRTLAPRLRLDPAFVHYRPHLPPSDARSLFLAMTSQMPGTIPSGPVPPDAIAYHCLDASRPVASELAMEESRLLDALGGALGSAAIGVPRTQGDP